MNDVRSKLTKTFVLADRSPRDPIAVIRGRQEFYNNTNKDVNFPSHVVL